MGKARFEALRGGDPGAYRRRDHRRHFLKGLAILAVILNVTAYEAGGLTSTGTKARSMRTAAVSRDLMHMMGKTIHVQSVGEFIVEDVTHKRMRRTVDIALGSREEAAKFGRKRLNVKIKGRKKR